MLSAVATALSMRERPGQTMLETLVQTLRSRQLLVILDNCEHLVQACAELAEALLRAGPELRILATSREPLNATGERAWRVPSLRLPPAEAPLVQATDSEAVRFFVDRARAVAPRFELSPANLGAVVQIVRRLDGIPLALELAAARLKALSAQQVADRLEDRFRLLVGGSRTALARQQTLRATVEWSYELLDQHERRLFDRLSVFAGGWTLDAAELVCGDHDADAVLAVLERLIDKSLVSAEESSRTVRFRMLETLRYFGREQLAGTPEHDALNRRHFDWILSEAERIQPSDLDPRAIAALEREEDNVRAGLHWAIDSGELEAGLRLAVAAAPLWSLRGHYAEGRTWLNTLLASQASPTVRANGLKWDAMLAFGQGDLKTAEERVTTAIETLDASENEIDPPVFVGILANIRAAHGQTAEARPLFESALDAYRARGLRYWEAVTLSDLAGILIELEEFALARSAAEQCVALGRRRTFEWATARALRLLARLDVRDGRLDRATELLDEALSLHEAIGDAMGAINTLRYQALTALQQQHVGVARARFLSALALAQESGDQLSVARCLEGLAGVLHAEEPVVAVRLLGAAHALRQVSDSAPWPSGQANLDRWTAAARAKLGERGFAEAFGEGELMSADEAAAMAREWVVSETWVESAPPPSVNGADQLTARQQEVAVLIARGYTNSQIADELVISPTTARAHIEHILDRLGLHSRAQIAAWAVAHDLVTE
jgi:predicted ATPase/DNA-binding CsgD family transcriptional regulator